MVAERAQNVVSQVDYTCADLVRAMREVGLEAGDVVLVHVDLDALGRAEGVARPIAEAELLWKALGEVLGDDGTVVVPTYTFSFCNHEPFDVLETPALGGPWSPSQHFLEHVRRRPGAQRSRDPIHSVAAVGPLAAELVGDLPPTCFGEGSVFSRLRSHGGKILMVGLPLEEATFRHHVEQMVGVPHRYSKLFTGQIRRDGSVRRTGWEYYVRILAENAAPDGTELERQALAAGVCRAAAVGQGRLLAVECEAYFQFTAEALTRDRWCTARGPAGDPLALEVARVPAAPITTNLPPDASMWEMVEGLWHLPRDIVSDGYDAALNALAEQVPMKVHEYPTGTECWSWIVPEKWTCHEAYLETLGGERLLSYADNPLHVVSYSLPFDGVVKREELFRHLHMHPVLADAIPFVFKYYERDWGLCATQRLLEQLTDEEYRVVIRTSFSYGHLKVGEVVAPGREESSVVLCAHLCHPAMVNDDLSGVVVGVGVMRALLRRKERRYTYRFLILPETIGSVAYLSHNEALIPRMKGGLFLEMLGLEHPHALQLSFARDTAVDRRFVKALMESDPAAWTGPFRSIIGNDERQFNAPGVRVPMLSLSRVLRPGNDEWPYAEYHSSADSPAAASHQRLQESRDVVLNMVDALEQSVEPRNRFRGEVFCSRYGINIDAYENPEGHKALFDIMYSIDGDRSVEEIAEDCGVGVEAAEKTLRQLARQGLVDLP